MNFYFFLRKLMNFLKLKKCQVIWGCKRSWQMTNFVRSLEQKDKVTFLTIKTKCLFDRGWCIKFSTGLNTKIDIVQKVYMWSTCPCVKMILQWGNYFGKRTIWSLLYTPIWYKRYYLFHYFSLWKVQKIDFIYFLSAFYPSAIDSYSIEPLPVLHLNLEFEWLPIFSTFLNFFKKKKKFKSYFM